MSDLGATLLRTILDFARARLEQLVHDVIDEAITDGKALLQPLLGHVPSQAQIDAYDTKKDQVVGHLTAARTHIEAVSNGVDAGPTTLAAGKPILDEAAAALSEIDEAVTIVATVVPEVGDARDALLKLLRKAIGDAGDQLSGLAKELGIAGSGDSLPDGFTLTDAGISYQAANADPRDLLSQDGITVTLSKTTVVGEFRFKTDRSLNVTLKTGAKAGFVSDGLVRQIVPGSADVDADIEIGVDSVAGLTLKGGSHQRVPLPGTLTIPGIDLRDLGLELPKPEAVIPAFGLTGTLAGRLGALGTTIDDLGIDIQVSPERLLSNGAGAVGDIVSFAAHPPAGLGLVVDAGIVKGGGYLFHRDTTYGGALDLRIGPVEVKAIGFVDTDPFSMVIVLSAEFTPSIQLGFGFTLNGVGGLLAVERTLSSDALVAGLENHTADLILFPKDPVGSAPTILDLLQAVFPARAGGFVVGPMFELGWGAPISFVTAKVGVLLSLPDPMLVIIGDVRVALPAPDAALIDLRAALYGEITPEHLLIRVSLSKSKISGFSVSGDIGILIVYGGEPDFAISAGGFHPSYRPPAELAGLERIEIDLSPPALLTMRAQAYVALTSNSVQLGAHVQIKADAGVVGAEGHLGFDALVQWAPRFLFIIDLEAGISLYAFGESFAGVDLHLHLEGPGPWVAHGTASVSLLFFDVDLDVGPITWGEPAAEAPAPVSPLELVAEALRTREAWTARLPEGADQLVTLAATQGDGIVVHPLGAFEVRQSKVPLETNIQRVGRNPVTAQRVVLGPPTNGNGDAFGSFSHVTDRFAPGQYLDLPSDQLMARPPFEELPAGIRMGGAAPAHGTEKPSILKWETVFPHQTFERRPRNLGLLTFVAASNASILATGLVANAARKRANAYAIADADPLPSPGDVFEVRTRSGLAVVADLGSLATAASAHDAIAAAVVADPGLAGSLQVVTKGLA
jgi:hypothetical protein